MNKEDIIRMAQKAGFDTDLPVFKDGSAIALKLADLVAAAEREACAKVCEKYGFDNHCGITTDAIAAAIRARGQDPMPLFDDWPGGWRK